MHRRAAQCRLHAVKQPIPTKAPYDDWAGIDLDVLLIGNVRDRSVSYDGGVEKCGCVAIGPLGILWAANNNAMLTRRQQYLTQTRSCIETDSGCASSSEVVAISTEDRGMLGRLTQTI
jgi:hypothetical protein